MHTTPPMSRRLPLGLMLATALAAPAWAGDAPNLITVTTTTDSADAFDQQCSLREALLNANTNTAFSPVANECPAGSGTATDSIQLASGATYLLTLPGADADTGDLDASDDPELGPDLDDLRIGIVGGNVHATIQQQVAGERVLHIAGARVSIADVVIRGGATAEVGGGIYNEAGSLRLDDVEVYDNTAVSGGGIYNDGDLVLSDSAMTFNTADLIGGGIFHSAGTLQVEASMLRGNAASSGGGIYNDSGAISIAAESTFQDNTASSDGAGIFHTGDDALVVSDTLFTGNISQGDGGGIRSDASVDAVLTDTDFVANEAVDGGGVAAGDTSADLRLIGGTFIDNIASDDGGAVYASYVRTLHTRFEGNSAANRGGAVFGGTGCTLRDSRFEANEAQDGGGVHCQVLEAERSHLHGNNATQRGGGMYVWNYAVITDSSFASNVSAGEGGGLWLAATQIGTRLQRNLLHANLAQIDGGGLWIGTTTFPVRITNTTISGNLAVNGTGSGMYIVEGGTVEATNITLANNTPGENLAKFGDLTLQNSIITTPDGLDCVAALDNPAIDSLGSNLSDDDSCVGLDFVTDQTEVDVLLAPLAATGGNTMTHALLPGSPAIDTGDNTACASDLVGGVDQRSGARDVGLNCDIGAHEQGAAVSFALFGDGFEQD